MLGLQEFLTICGNITLSQIITVSLAIAFFITLVIKLKKYLDKKEAIIIQKHEAEKEKDEQLKSVLAEVAKYPEYREQSRKIQKQLQNEIDNIKEILNDMQKKQERRERNKLRDKLLQSYRYYTNKEKNPTQTWTKMESEAFWALFRDYEDVKGDGYIHTVVQPAMNLLEIIDN